MTVKNDDNTAYVIANPNVDNNVTFQIEPSTSELMISYVASLIYNDTLTLAKKPLNLICINCI